MSETQRTMFEFETDFVDTLRCIPMAVRYKLDQSGVKLSLKHWGSFNHEERDQLVNRPCEAPADVAAYRENLAALIERRSGEPARSVALEPSPDWADVHRVPGAVVDLAMQSGATPPSLSVWAALTPLQRFALVKLTKPGHDNVNFIPAMREFGLLRRA